jgi:hypothetical protein
MSRVSPGAWWAWASPSSPQSRWICEWFRADGAARSAAHIAGTELKLTSGAAGIENLPTPERPQADAFLAAARNWRELEPMRAASSSSRCSL